METPFASVGRACRRRAVSSCVVHACCQHRGLREHEKRRCESECWLRFDVGRQLSQPQHRTDLGQSGGNDSSALAIFMKEKEPELDIEYFFTDTGKELPEVYEFLDKIQASYGIKVNYLAPDTGNSNDSPFD